MRRHIIHIGLITAALAGFGLQAQAQSAAEVGSISKELSFSTWNASNQLENKKLSDYANKVLVVFYYTPW